MNKNSFNDIENLGIQVIREVLDESSLVSITDGRGVITFANKKFCDVSKYSEKFLIGKTHSVLNSGYHPISFWKNMYKVTVEDKKIWNDKVKNVDSDGNYYWVNTWIQAIFDDDNKVVGFISVRQDVTSEVNMRDQLLKQKDLLVDENNSLKKLSIQEKNVDNRGSIAKILVFAIFFILVLSVLNDYVHDNSSSFKDIAMIFSGGLMGGVVTILGINQTRKEDDDTKTN